MDSECFAAFLTILLYSIWFDFVAFFEQKLMNLKESSNSENIGLG